ncbi:unnamed protein product [Ambrosiozyma monospora]|uniref:Unnamed protein product n=1 Tax=Ambrosiozyma monospora TaxID=43982 RepID=A0ACB5UCM0_AMBMO|nr:unnamed protein product [Ambrosiozyma monospora]
MKFTSFAALTTLASLAKAADYSNSSYPAPWGTGWFFNGQIHWDIFVPNKIPFNSFDLYADVENQPFYGFQFDPSSYTADLQNPSGSLPFEINVSSEVELDLTFPNPHSSVSELSHFNCNER